MQTISSIAVAVLLQICTVPAHQATAPPMSAAPTGAQTKTKSGLIYETVVKGTGAVAESGDTVRIHEALSLPDGRVIFNSRDKNQTVTFLLGGNQVIPGVDEGVTGMRVGERRKLLVPPSLDGRKFDPSLVPPDAIRHYDVELVEIVKSPIGRAQGQLRPKGAPPNGVPQPADNHRSSEHSVSD